MTSTPGEVIDVQEVPALHIVRRVYEELSKVLKLVSEIRAMNYKEGISFYMALAFLLGIKEEMPEVMHMFDTALGEISRPLAAQYEKIWRRKGLGLAREYLLRARRFVEGDSSSFMVKLLSEAGAPIPRYEEVVEKWFRMDGESLLREVRSHVASLKRSGGKVAALFLSELLKLCGYVPEDLVDEIARSVKASKDWICYKAIRGKTKTRKVRAYIANIRDARVQLSFIEPLGKMALKPVREKMYKLAFLMFSIERKERESRVEKVCKDFSEAAVDALLKVASDDYSKLLARPLSLKEYDELMRGIGKLAYRLEGHFLMDRYGDLGLLSDEELRLLTGSMGRFLTCVLLASLAESKGFKGGYGGSYNIGGVRECREYINSRIAPIYKEVFKAGSRVIDRIIDDSLSDLVRGGVLWYSRNDKNPSAGHYAFLQSRLLSFIFFMKDVVDEEVMRVIEEDLKIGDKRLTLYSLPEYLQGLSREERRTFIEKFLLNIEHVRIFLRYYLRLAIGEALYAIRLVPMPSSWLRKLVPRRDILPIEAILRRTAAKKIYVSQSSVLFLLHRALLEALLSGEARRIKERIAEVMRGL